MEPEMTLDSKNIIVMKLLHYFITEKNYNPIILQGVENEIWLENLDEEYQVVRIVSGYIHNDEQFAFDKFKTKRIVKKISKKTLSFNMNVLSIFLNLGENVTEKLDANPNALCVKIDDEDDLKKSSVLKNTFPDLKEKSKFEEKGFELFLKITSDINKHNDEDAKKVEKIFSPKTPYITYGIIIINILLYIIPLVLGSYDYVVTKFGVNSTLIKSGEYYRLFTGIFMHANILHLFFNCYALYVIGAQVESYLGKTKYILIYLYSGIVGALFSCLFTKGLSIGASGAIFGLMGALLYFGYYYRVYLGNVLKSQLIPLIILNLVLGFLNTSIDNAAHIGGLIAGILITFGLGVKDKSSNFEKVNGIIVSLIFIGFLVYMAIFR